MAITKDTIIEPTDVVNVQVRNVPAHTWHRMKVEAVSRSVPLGDIANEAFALWLAKHNKPERS